MMKDILFIVLLMFCTLRGPNMPYASILSIYRSLLLALGILACVLWTWGNAVCSAALKKAKDEEKYKGAANEASEALTPLFCALGLFLATLGILFVAPFLKEFDIPEMLCTVLKACASWFSLVIFFVISLILYDLGDHVNTLQHLVNRAETETDMRARFMLGHRIKSKKEED